MVSNSFINNKIHVWVFICLMLISLLVKNLEKYWSTYWIPKTPTQNVPLYNKNAYLILVSFQEDSRLLEAITLTYRC